MGIVFLAACSTGTPERSAAPNGSPSPGDPGLLAHLPGLPVSAMPGYVTRATSIDTQSLASEALDAPSLESLLTRSGFQGGAERRFTARARRLTQVVARVLKFRSVEGADAYLAWFASHGPDLLGSQVGSTSPPGFPGAVAFRHGPSGCCTKDTFQYVAAWTRGPYAITLLVGGPAAGRGSAAPIAEELDARVRKEGP